MCKVIKNALFGLVIMTIALALIFASTKAGQVVGSYFGIDSVLSGLIGVALFAGVSIGALKEWIEK